MVCHSHNAECHSHNAENYKNLTFLTNQVEKSTKKNYSKQKILAAENLNTFHEWTAANDFKISCL